MAASISEPLRAALAALLLLAGAARAEECPPAALAAATLPAFRPGEQEIAYPPPRSLQPELLLVGDSLLHWWPPRLLGVTFGKRSVESIAHQGDTTGMTLSRLQQPGVAALRPAPAVVLIGTNNLAGGAPACAVAAGIEAVVRRLRLQNQAARILVLHLPPRGAEGREFDAARRAVNAAIDAMPRRLPGVEAVPLDATFDWRKPDAARLYQPDLLHLSHQGYQMLGLVLSERLR